MPAVVPVRLAVHVFRLPVPVVLFLVAATLRVLSFAVFYVGSLATGHNGQVDFYDSVGIDHWAWYAAQSFRGGHWVNLTPYDLEGAWDVGFTYFVAIQYVVVGHFPEVPRVINACLAAFTAPAAYMAARSTVLGEAVARRAGWLTALWPLSIYWAGYDLLKDPAVWFCLALALIAIAAETRRRFVGLSLAAAVPIQLVRLYMGTALYAFLPVVAIIRRDWRGLATLLACLALSEVVLVGVHYPPVWSIVPYHGNGIPFLNSGPSSTGGVAGTIGSIGGDDPNATSQVEGSGSDALSTLSGPKTIVKRLAVGLVVTALGPRPALKDLVHPTLDTAMYPGLLVWIPLIPFTLLGAWRALWKRDARVLSILLFSVSLWAGIALLFAGGAFRQREMAFPSTLVLTSLGLQAPLPRRWWWIYGGFVAAGAAALALRVAGAF